MSDETEIAAVVAAMYDMISGPAGPRDWSRQREIFDPDARLMRTGIDDAGASWLRNMSLDDYRTNVTPIFMAHGFFETEIGHRADVFGNMAHVWSAYEARINADDATPERRGINSIQLYRDETGIWRIVSMIWDNEREGRRAVCAPTAPHLERRQHRCKGERNGSGDNCADGDVLDAKGAYKARGD